jgi:hypothetical protein
MAMLGSIQTERVRRNHRGGDLSASQLLDLLQYRVAFGAERASRELVRRMSAHEHYNRAAHTAGSRDKTAHYTVWVKGKGHHLRLDSRGIVFQITDEYERDLGTVPPWVAPGA